MGDGAARSAPCGDAGTESEAVLGRPTTRTGDTPNPIQGHGGARGLRVESNLHPRTAARGGSGENRRCPPGGASATANPAAAAPTPGRCTRSAVRSAPGVVVKGRHERKSRPERVGLPPTLRTFDVGTSSRHRRPSGSSAGAGSVIGAQRTPPRALPRFADMEKMPNKPVAARATAARRPPMTSIGAPGQGWPRSGAHPHHVSRQGDRPASFPGGGFGTSMMCSGRPAASHHHGTQGALPTGQNLRLVTELRKHFPNPPLHGGGPVIFFERRRLPGRSFRATATGPRVIGGAGHATSGALRPCPLTLTPDIGVRR